MSRIAFRVDGIPVGQPRPRAFARRLANGKAVAGVYDPGTADGWKTMVVIAAKSNRPAETLQGPVEVALQFVFPRPKAHFRANGQLKPSAPSWHASKPDVDNAAKAVLDTLTQLAFWKDDDQVAQLTVSKRYGENPGAMVVIQALQPPQPETPQGDLFKPPIND